MVKKNIFLYLWIGFLIVSICIVSLLGQKAKVEISTPLHEAVRNKNIGLIDKLLKEGADPDEREGKTKYFSVYSLFRSKKDIEKNKKKNSKLFKVSGWPATHWAVYLNDKRIFKMLLEEGSVDATDPFGTTPLQWASKWGNTDITKTLIDQGADVDHQDYNGFTPLHYAMLNGDKKNLGIIDLLIESGADMYARDKSGRYPVHLATQNGYFRALKRLIDLDNNVIYSKDKQGNNVLHLAAANGSLNVVKGLLDFPISIDEPNEQGITALHWAALNQNIKVIDYLIKKGADINYRDNQGKTILHKLAQWGYYKTLDYLIKKYKKIIDFDAVDDLQQTALHKAVINGNLESAKLLANAGTNLELADYENETALQKAVYSGRLRIAKYLLRKGANYLVANDEANSLLWSAVANSDFEMAQLLIERGSKVIQESGELFNLTKNRNLLIYLRERLLAEQEEIQ